MPLYKDDISKLEDPHQVTESGDTKPKIIASEGNNGLLDTEEEEEGPARAEDDDDDEEESSSWLESFGFQKSDFPQLNPDKIKFQTDNILKWDNRPQSLVYIQGPDIHALYNFLLNYRNMVAAVGVQAGVPPSILSPVCFEGGTLRSCKVKSGSMRQQVGNRLQDINTLEVNGPILPHSIHLLASLLQESQRGLFNAALMNHEPSSCFSSLDCTLDKTEIIKDAFKFGHKAGVPQTLISELYCRRGHVTSALKEVKCQKNVFEWT